MVRKGRFGPYVQHGNTVANLPRDVAMDEITLDEAVALLAEQGQGAEAEAGPQEAAAKAPAKKPAAPPSKPRRSREEGAAEQAGAERAPKAG